MNRDIFSGIDKEILLFTVIGLVVGLIISSQGIFGSIAVFAATYFCVVNRKKIKKFIVSIMDKDLDV